MADFEARLGGAAHPGLASRTVRLGPITPGRNPYVTGHARPPDSPVSFGRERLAEEEVLERDGPTYRFWVPLYCP